MGRGGNNYAEGDRRTNEQTDKHENSFWVYVAVSAVSYSSLLSCVSITIPVTAASTLSSFCRYLKSHLFTKSFPS